MGRKRASIARHSRPLGLRGVSVAGIAAREAVTAKRVCRFPPGHAPFSLELQGKSALGLRLREKVLAKVANVFHVCSRTAVPEEKAECLVPSKPFRLPPHEPDWSGPGARRAWREEPIVGLLNRGVSIGGAAAR